MSQQHVSHRIQPDTILFVIPEHGDEGGEYPGGLSPGPCTVEDVVRLLREHRDNPSVIQFIADMMEP